MAKTAHDCKDAVLGSKLAALHTSATALVAGLGAPMVALALALKNDWQTVYQAAVEAKGAMGGSATSRRQAAVDLKTSLGLLRLELGKQLLRQSARLTSLFPQHFLGQPVEDGGEDDGGGEPELPEPPTGVGITQANPGEAVQASADALAGATLWKVFARAVGSTEAPVLVASAASLPTSFTIAPGDYEFTMTVTTAAGESAPSSPVTLTVD